MIILYERFANKENIEARLAELELAEHERGHLVGLLRKLYQQHLLTGILDLLAEEDRSVFLEKFYYGPEAEVVSFLQDRIENPNDKMGTLVANLELEIFPMLERKR